MLDVNNGNYLENCGWETRNGFRSAVRDILILVGKVLKPSMSDAFMEKVRC